MVEKPPDEKERLNAAELLGKRYGIFSDRVSVSVTFPVVFFGESYLKE